jgi:hypothetical protein
LTFNIGQLVWPPSQLTGEFDQALASPPLRTECAACLARRTVHAA